MQKAVFVPSTSIDVETGTEQIDFFVKDFDRPDLEFDSSESMIRSGDPVENLLSTANRLVVRPKHDVFMAEEIHEIGRDVRGIFEQ